MVPALLRGVLPDLLALRRTDVVLDYHAATVLGQRRPLPLDFLVTGPTLFQLLGCNSGHSAQLVLQPKYLLTLLIVLTFQLQN